MFTITTTIHSHLHLRRRSIVQMVDLGERLAFRRDFETISHLLPHHSIRGLIPLNLLFYLMQNWLLHRISLRSLTVSAFFVSTKVENRHTVPTTQKLLTMNPQIPLTTDHHLNTSLPTIHLTILRYFASFPGTTMARIRSQ
jgi:hypothetical protein